MRVKRQPSPCADRNAAIYHERRSGITLRELSDKYRLSIERVRQIANREQSLRVERDGRLRTQREMYESYIADFLEIINTADRDGDNEAD